MIMKNAVSNEIIENIFIIDQLINNLNKTIKSFEKDNENLENTFNDLVFQYKDHSTDYGDIGDKKYAHSA